LLELLNKRQDHELIYLSIKFLWKAVHYEINAEIKNLACAWMPLLHLVIGATNPQFDAHPEEHQARESTEFYYFHSKKWATRIFLRFIQKHAKRVSYNKNEDNRSFSDHWYNTYGGPLITALISQFEIPTVKKVRYFQLKCLQVLITERPDSVRQYSETFQYNVLLNYLRLQPEDEELANRDPVEFLSREDEPSINFTNLKRVATDVWVGFAEIGSKPEKKALLYEPGVNFFQNMTYLQGKLEGGGMIEKELAMYLICQLRTPITKCRQVKKMLPTLISKYVISEFQNPIMFLRARAVDIFTEYGSMELDIDIVKMAVEGIYICLTKD
jgi:importin-7